MRLGFFRNSTLKKVGVLRGSFKGFGCPKRHPDALQGKTMSMGLISIQDTNLSSRVLARIRNWVPKIGHCKILGREVFEMY